MPPPRGTGASQQEAPVRDVRERRPDLLAGHHPVGAVLHRPGRHPGQVGTGSRLGIALAPQLIPGRDRGEKPLPLLLATVRQQCRRQQVFTHVVDAVRRTRQCVLLMENDLLQQGRASAMWLRPAEADPTVDTQAPLPLMAELEALVLAARSAGGTKLCEFAGQIGSEPVPPLVAEGLIGSRQPQIHAAYRTVGQMRSDAPSGLTGQPRQLSIETPRLRFEALTCGEGPLALCLHGFPDSAQTWRWLLPELAAAGFRAVAPWTRGYAPTECPADDDFSLSALAADANALHETLGGDGDAVLIGHDWGAMTAYLAAATPGRWRRIAALAVPPPQTAARAFLDYDQLRRSFYVHLFQTPLAEFVVAADNLRFLDRLWADWSTGYDASDDLPAVKAALGDAPNLRAAIGYYRAMFSSGVPMESPGVPTLYLHGREDGAFGAELTTGVEAELPTGSQVELVEGAGHFLHLERPDAVNRRLIDWLTENGDL